MFYLLLADLIVVVHFLFILFVILGGLLVLYRRWVAWLHVPAALWGAGIELYGCLCPLTPLEVWLRETGGRQGYAQGFIEHYLLPVIYPAGLTTKMQVAFGLAVVVVNIVIYCFCWSRKRRRQGKVQSQ